MSFLLLSVLLFVTSPHLLPTFWPMSAKKTFGLLAIRERSAHQRLFPLKTRDCANPVRKMADVSDDLTGACRPQRSSLSPDTAVGRAGGGLPQRVLGPRRKERQQEWPPQSLSESDGEDMQDDEAGGAEPVDGVSEHPEGHEQLPPVRSGLARGEEVSADAPYVAPPSGPTPTGNVGVPSDAATVKGWIQEAVQVSLAAALKSRKPARQAVIHVSPSDSQEETVPAKQPRVAIRQDSVPLGRGRSSDESGEDSPDLLRPRVSGSETLLGNPDKGPSSSEEGEMTEDSAANLHSQRLSLMVDFQPLINQAIAALDL
ncbi:uncharacterized protein LOC128324629 [Hemicordylus capensis]|uniref:uncharacterized protein LOC128324629 n=1 Tax=Hemicordylus capensis TaxID=884348 RepID=UPI002302521C|nr:uncharacterized protein LOC128324629 [Hemicordylus capensis]